MKAVTWQGKRDVRVEEVPDPQIAHQTDAIIKITSTIVNRPTGRVSQPCGGVQPPCINGVGDAMQSLSAADAAILSIVLTRLYAPRGKVATR